MFQVIEMSGVCAASDIWSVGCTVIELLTCVPPYYDLQPMPALFRIVQVCELVVLMLLFSLYLENDNDIIAYNVLAGIYLIESLVCYA